MVVNIETMKKVTIRKHTQSSSCRNINTCSAMKSACNELKGCTCLFHANDGSLKFPLMALIHYRGYCLLAICIVCGSVLRQILKDSLASSR